MPSKAGERVFKRTCRYCGREYRVPRGSARLKGCPECAPQFPVSTFHGARIEPTPGQLDVDGNAVEK